MQYTVIKTNLACCHAKLPVAWGPTLLVLYAFVLGSATDFYCGESFARFNGFSSCFERPSGSACRTGGRRGMLGRWALRCCGPVSMYFALF
jgi:hypothetical protein